MNYSDTETETEKSHIKFTNQQTQKGIHVGQKHRTFNKAVTWKILHIYIT